MVGGGTKQSAGLPHLIRLEVGDLDCLEPMLSLVPLDPSDQHEVPRLEALQLSVHLLEEAGDSDGAV